MNYMTLAGHLGADPEVRFTSSGAKVTTLRLACRSRKGQSDVTIWWRVSVWGEHLDKLISYFKKGSAIMAMGEMQSPEIYTDRDGNPQVSMSMTARDLAFSPFGKGKSENTQTSTMQDFSETSSEGQGFAQMGSSVKPSAETPAMDQLPADDEIPF